MTKPFKTDYERIRHYLKVSAESKSKVQFGYGDSILLLKYTRRRLIAKKKRRV